MESLKEMVECADVTMSNRSYRGREKRKREVVIYTQKINGRK